MPGVGYASREDPRGIALLSVLKSLKGSSKPTTSVSSSEQASEVLPIKESNLQQLYKKLGDQTLDYGKRAHIAVEVRQLLSKFEADCIPAVWYSAHDLIRPGIPEATRKCAFELLAECIDRCRDAEVRPVFFHIVMDSLVTIPDKKYQNLDPQIAIILSCLTLLLDGSVQLDEEDSSVLRSIIEDIIDSLQIEKHPEARAIAELIQIVPLLKNQISEDKLSKLLGLLSLALKTSSLSSIDLSPGALDYILYLTQEHNMLLTFHDLHQVILVLDRTTIKPDDVRHIERLKCVLHQIVRSRYQNAFLEELFKEARQKTLEHSKILDLYAFILVDDVRRFGPSDDHSSIEKQVNYVLDNLFQIKKYRATLKIISSLVRLCEEQKQPETFKHILMQEHLWNLLKSTLIKSTHREDNVSFIECILDVAAITKASPFKTSLDHLLQFFLSMQYPELNSHIIELIDVLRSSVNDIKTLSDISSCALSPQSSLATHIELYDLLVGLLNDTSFEALNDTGNLFKTALNVFIKSRGLDMSEKGLMRFQEFLYVYLRELQTGELSIMVNEYIIPDIQVALAQKRRKKSIVETLGNFGRPKQVTEHVIRRADALVIACVRTFVWSPAETSGEKCVLLFNSLCSIYSIAEKYAHCNASLAVARAMVRIRKSVAGYFYFTIPVDAVGISSAFNRLKERATDPSNTAKWTFPESVEYIDECLLGIYNENIGFKVSDKDPSSNVNIGKWLSLAIESIKSPTDWEIYSYLLAHLCSQVSEISLLSGHLKLIENFKDVICDHLTRVVPLSIEMSDDVSDSDLHSAYVRSLSSILAYHPYQQKKFADELLSALVVGLKSWEKTLIPILHILSVSCFEVPLSIQRCLSQLLPQIQMRITNPYAMPSVLEFLLALRNSPRVISNLTIDELRRVFGIVLKLIENSVDLKVRSKLESEKDELGECKFYQPHNLDYEVASAPSTENYSINESMVLFLQYQSFEVLSSWCCSLSTERIKELLPFIVSKLENLESFKDLKYDALAHIDFVQRSQCISQPSWSDVDEDGDVTERGRWIGESALISIKSRESSATVKLWKPTCTVSFDYKPRFELNQPTYDVFGFNNSKGTGEGCPKKPLSPEAVLLQLSYLLEPVGISHRSLLRVPDDVNFNRSIGTLDRLPNKEFQKTGIIYIGPDQSTETQVLSNTRGSQQYHWFLDQMGQFIKLSEKPKLFYTGGLEDVIDGEYALIWSDEISHIAFHTITMMPQSTDLSSKKKHVGNNFVNIFYNESQLSSFNFNIIKSQFTFISIVITPQTAPTAHTVSEHYKIKLYRRTGTPGLLSCAHFKMLTKNNLARYVRHVSQIANAFAEKTHQRHPPDACSAWGTRYKQLRTIRERVDMLNSH